PRFPRVALDGNSLEVHEKARNASVRTLDDAAQRLFEHRHWRLVQQNTMRSRISASTSRRSLLLAVWWCPPSVLAGVGAAPRRVSVRRENAFSRESLGRPRLLCRPANLYA